MNTSASARSAPISVPPSMSITLRGRVFAVAFARIECHYFINEIFVEEAHILNNISKIQNIPTFIVQGRYDVVCPTRSAWDLHKAMPGSVLEIISDSGHSMGEIGIARQLVAFTDEV